MKVTETIENVRRFTRHYAVYMRFQPHKLSPSHSDSSEIWTSELTDDNDGVANAPIEANVIRLEEQHCITVRGKNYTAHRHAVRMIYLSGEVAATYEEWVEMGGPERPTNRDFDREQWVPVVTKVGGTTDLHPLENGDVVLCNGKRVWPR